MISVPGMGSGTSGSWQIVLQMQKVNQMLIPIHLSDLSVEWNI